jgi:hypothetical protein
LRVYRGYLLVNVYIEGGVIIGSWPSGLRQHTVIYTAVISAGGRCGRARGNKHVHRVWFEKSGFGLKHGDV